MTSDEPSSFDILSGLIKKTLSPPDSLASVSSILRSSAVEQNRRRQKKKKKKFNNRRIREADKPSGRAWPLGSVWLCGKTRRRERKIILIPYFFESLSQLSLLRAATVGSPPPAPFLLQRTAIISVLSWCCLTFAGYSQFL